MLSTSGNLPIDIYARVSKKRKSGRQPRGGTRELSTTGQVAVCRERLAKLGLPEGEVFTDPGKSAWNPKVKRPGWDKAMHRLETGVSGGMIIFDLERFTRQPIDGERLITLADRGIKVLDSEDEYDLRTANGKKNFRDGLTAAAYYSDRQSTKVRRGKRLRALDGCPPGGDRAFGFEDDGETVRESEAAIIREATARILAKEPQHTVVEDLRARNVRTARGVLFTDTILRQILTRQRNCGRITYTDPDTKVTSVVSRLPGKPIVEEEDFDRLCAIYTARRRGRPRSYVSSAHAICGGCQTPMYGKKQERHIPYPDGEVRRHYVCATVNNGNRGCGRGAVDQRALDEVAKRVTVEILSDPCNTSAIEAAAREINSKAAQLDLKIADAEAIALALSGRLGRGEISLERHDVAVKPLDTRIAQMKAERAALAPAELPEIPQEASREEWRRRWERGSDDVRRDLLARALRGRHMVVERVEHAQADGTATRRDVAARAGVSPVTVDRALRPATRHLVSPETARRVIDAAGSMGYAPRRELRHRLAGSDRVEDVMRRVTVE